MELRLEIDPLRLDEEWIGQPKQRQEYGERLADAQFVLDQAKSKLEVLKAELDALIRKDPAMFGLAKITEGAVATTVTAHPGIVDAVAAVNEAKHTVNILQAAVDGLEHRKRALTMLVELHGQAYFASPTTGMPAGVKSRRRREDGDGID